MWNTPRPAASLCGAAGRGVHKSSGDESPPPAAAGSSTVAAVYAAVFGELRSSAAALRCRIDW